MQEFEILKSLVIILGVSGSVVFLLHRLRLPSIIGFLVAGVLLGPHGFGFIKDIHEVELLAEIGIILLLFTIGLDFSLKNLFNFGGTVLGGGFSQVSLTIIITATVAYFLFIDPNSALFTGFVIALSSTAIVFKMLSDRGEIDTPHGRLAVGILIFQDMCIVPFILLVPILSGEDGLARLMSTIGKIIIILGTIIFGARWLVPHILYQIVRTRSRELFIITIIFLCLGTALLTSGLGLSLALGAFLAGLIISESEYAYQALAEILPFKDSFIGIFFISVGMLMDTGFLGSKLSLVLPIVLAIFFLKTLTGLTSGLILGYTPRVAIQTGLNLSQIGELSFVLAIAGKEAGLISDDHYQLFLSASIITMAMTPFIINTSPWLSSSLSSRILLKRVARIKDKARKGSFPGRKVDHVIIVGFGLNGRNLARVLREIPIPYMVIELNGTTVRSMKSKGEPIFYGDGTRPEILHKAGLGTAKVLVIAISDPASTRAIVQLARKDHPELYIIVRTRYTTEVEDLKGLGANEVIPEEFETSIEIFARVLHHYHVPKNFIMGQIDRVRKDSYQVLRDVELPRKSLTERYEMLYDIETETFLIEENSWIARHSLGDLRLRTETGATVLAVKRADNNIYPNPGAEFMLRPLDILFLVGTKEHINTAVNFLSEKRFLK
jgi:CPA2 family monovalent cation:H+ antiporter-2